MSTAPISPAAAKAAQKTAIPSVVFKVANQLLTMRADENPIFIGQEEVLLALEAKGISRVQAFNESLLDFEEAYRTAGWEVEYAGGSWDKATKTGWTFRASQPEA